MTARYRQSLVLSTALAALFAAASVRPVSAQSVTGSGDLSAGPIQTPDRNMGSDLTIGDTGRATLTIDGGGTVNVAGAGGGAAAGYIGYAALGQGTVNVASSSGNTSSLTTTDYLVVGENGTGILNIGKGGAKRV